MATGFWKELLDLNSVCIFAFGIIDLKVGGETRFLNPEKFLQICSWTER